MSITPPDAPNSIWVMLTEIRGILNGVADQVAGISRVSDRHTEEIGWLKSLTQTLRESAEADRDKALALAAALKEAEETRRVKSDTTWTPTARLITVIGAVGALAVLYSVFKP
jgi:hypothetical protein